MPWVCGSTKDLQAAEVHGVEPICRTLTEAAAKIAFKAGLERLSVHHAAVRDGSRGGWV